MIEYASTSADEEVDTLAEFPRLVVDVNASVDSEGLELVGRMFELGQLVLHLDGELSSRRDHDGLDPVCSKKVPLAQIFSEW